MEGFTLSPAGFWVLDETEDVETLEQRVTDIEDAPFALKSDIPKLDDYAKKSDVPVTTNLASKDSVKSLDERLKKIESSTVSATVKP